MRACRGAKARGREAELLAEPAANAAGMETLATGPARNAQAGFGDQRGREHIRPILDMTSARDYASRQRPACFFGIAFGDACDPVGIRQATMDRALPIARQRKDKHLRRAGEAIEMTLERAVNQDIAGDDAMPAGVAGFDISARENDCREGRVVTVPVEHIVRMMMRVADPADFGGRR
jgi:hypothetical protein